MNEDIRDIKPLMILPSHWHWDWIFLALVVICVAAWLVILFLKAPPEEEKIEVVPLKPWEKAYDRLENLRLKKLIERPYLKPFYIELSDIIRRYLEERFSIKAPEMTTEEFLQSLESSPVLNEAEQSMLKEFLHMCDMVKFAKFQPSREEAQRSFDLVKLIIDQTYGT